ncbi:hypothetical protein JXB02_04605 [Candidatus Woesearchaeota archaeon]|nr:hypothetical protein [Candidatus Woesearchaeota archaeon]
MGLSRKAVVMALLLGLAGNAAGQDGPRTGMLPQQRFEAQHERQVLFLPGLEDRLGMIEDDLGSLDLAVLDRVEGFPYTPFTATYALKGSIPIISLLGNVRLGTASLRYDAGTRTVTAGVTDLAAVIDAFSDLDEYRYEALLDSHGYPVSFSENIHLENGERDDGFRRYSFNASGDTVVIEERVPRPGGSPKDTSYVFSRGDQRRYDPFSALFRLLGDPDFSGFMVIGKKTRALVHPMVKQEGELTYYAFEFDKKLLAEVKRGMFVAYKGIPVAGYFEMDGIPDFLYGSIDSFVYGTEILSVRRR